MTRSRTTFPLPEHLRDAIAQDWDAAPPMPHPASPEVAPWAAARRGALSARFPGRAIVVPAGGLEARGRTTPTTRSARPVRSPG